MPPRDLRKDGLRRCRLNEHLFRRELARQPRHKHQVIAVLHRDVVLVTGLPRKLSTKEVFIEPTALATRLFSNHVEASGT